MNHYLRVGLIAFLLCLATGVVFAHDATAQPSVAWPPLVACVTSKNAPCVQNVEQATLTFPLAETGPYAVGIQLMTLTDSSRQGRVMKDEAWYPAVVPTTPTAQQKTLEKYGWFKAAVDPQAGPAPLILITPGWDEPYITYQMLATTLASQGFFVVGVDNPQDDSPLAFVNRPLDVLFTLDQLTSINQTDFGGIIDTDHVGVMGDSLGAYTTLVLTGARIDPALASAIIAKPLVSSGLNDSDPRLTWPDWTWDAVSAYHDSLSPLPKDGLWSAATDPRIHAAVMFSPCWIPMFGKQGLAAATVPSLIIGGTSDDVCLYQQDDPTAFAQLGSPDRYLLSIINGGHVPDRDEPVVAQLYTAFFDLYLKGKQDEAQYLTADYVNSVEAQLKLGLVWGPYSNNPTASGTK